MRLIHKLYQEYLIITIDLLFHPIKTMRQIIKKEKLHHSLPFLVISTFLIILLELPKEYQLINAGIHRHGIAWLILIDVIWAVQVPMLLCLILGTSLWLNCLYHKTKIKLMNCLTISAYALSPGILFGCLFGSVLIYLRDSDNTSLIFLLPTDMLNTHFYIFAQMFDIFMAWSIILLSVAGAFLSNITFKRNCEIFLPIWVVICILSSFIFQI